MTRPQRILLILALPVIAWVLHVNLCDWVWKAKNLPPSAQHPRRPILVIRTADPNTRMVEWTGCVNEWNIPVEQSVVWGMAVPLGLFVMTVFLALGWRVGDRVSRGQCRNCGYDLRGHDPKTPCPECGARA